MTTERGSSCCKTRTDVVEYDDGLSLSRSGDSEVDVNLSTKDRVETVMESSIARKEERVVYFFRLLVLLAIVFASVAVSVAVFSFASASDIALFEVEVSMMCNVHLRIPPVCRHGYNGHCTLKIVILYSNTDISLTSHGS